ncbi:MAG: transcription antitermination factor NusB, partial [Actinobacteria bacterium]|nr:transcription antitermination factor NusB [Actinomycetota bacterium]
MDARERALELLYEADLKDRPVMDVVHELPVAPDPFTAELLGLVQLHRDDIDADLTRVARGWSLDRMPVVDRAVLRLAVAELGWMPDTPVAVVLNEAVELVKCFSTDASGRFV